MLYELYGLYNAVWELGYNSKCSDMKTEEKTEAHGQLVPLTYCRTADTCLLLAWFIIANITPAFKQFLKLFPVNIIFLKLTNHISDYIQGLCQHLPCLWCLESLDSASCFQLIMSPSSLASVGNAVFWKFETSVKAETLAEPACLWDFLREEIKKGLRNPLNLNPTPNCWKFFHLRLSYSH